jgi:TPR repeat protein
MEQRHPEALYDVGHYHLEGSEGRERNSAMALAYFEAAGDAGHPDALCSAGAMYFNGIGTAEVLKLARAVVFPAVTRGA